MYCRKRNPGGLLVLLRTELGGLGRRVVHKRHPGCDIKAPVLVFPLTKHKAVACPHPYIDPQKVFLAFLPVPEFYFVPVVGCLKTHIEPLNSAKQVIRFEVKTGSINPECIVLKQEFGLFETKDADAGPKA